MGFSPAVRARIDAGLCMKCGVVRGVDGSGLRCGLCHAAMLAYQREWHRRSREARSAEENAAVDARKRAGQAALYASRRAALCCTRCGGRLTGRNYVDRRAFCRDCELHVNAGAARRTVAKRAATSPWRRYRGGKPLQLGKAVRVKWVRRYTIQVDSGAYRAIKELKRRDRVVQQKRSKDGSVEVVYQVSRIVREAICVWAEVAAVPLRLAGYREMIECAFNFRADARTAATIERHRAARGGNISATVCDMLAASAAIPDWTVGPPTLGALRLSAGGTLAVDPWDDDE